MQVNLLNCELRAVFQNFSVTRPALFSTGGGGGGGS